MQDVDEFAPRIRLAFEFQDTPALASMGVEAEDPIGHAGVAQIQMPALS